MRAQELPKMFPIFLKIEGRRVLVVGAGPVATEKITALVETGADITVISPEAIEEVRELAASGRVRWLARPYASGDTEGYSIVVASTNNPLVNRAVYRAANRRGVPVNVVDVPELCDFYFGSIVRRDPVLVAISTAGASPALASRLRRYLDSILPKNLGKLARSLADTRPKLKRAIPSFTDRVRVVSSLLDDHPFADLDETAEDEIERNVHDWIQEVAG